jgi:peptidoglycan/LPS O-acetylase OafA/YrhL
MRRDASYDLLRLLSCIGVIVIHVGGNIPGGGVR